MIRSYRFRSICLINDHDIFNNGKDYDYLQMRTEKYLYQE